MGKVKPPKEAFDDWTPEQQQGYNDKIASLEAERDTHKANESHHMANSYEYDEMADQCEEEGDTVGVWALSASANNEVREAAKERAAAEKIDEDIEARRIDPEGGGENAKYDYLNEVQDNLNADREKRRELRAKRDALIALSQLRYIDSHEFDKQIALLNEQINQLNADIKFNVQCLSNTFPPDMPPPPPPATPPSPYFITEGAFLQCSMSVPCPARLKVLPSRLIYLEGKLMANVTDITPAVNLPSMGQCISQANPVVAAATAAKLGVPTPAPCAPPAPVAAGPWQPGDPTVLLQNSPALLNTDTLKCVYGGIITILPGPPSVNVSNLVNFDEDYDDELEAMKKKIAHGDTTTKDQLNKLEDELYDKAVGELIGPFGSYLIHGNPVGSTKEALDKRDAGEVIKDIGGTVTDVTTGALKDIGVPDAAAEFLGETAGAATGTLDDIGKSAPGGLGGSMGKQLEGVAKRQEEFERAKEAKEADEY